MEGVINSAIKQHLPSTNLLTDTQSGFCQGHSAPDLITALVQTWTKELNSRGEVNKSRRPDGIYPRILGEARDEIAGAFTEIFVSSLAI
eukprot:g47407.t1